MLVLEDVHGSQSQDSHDSDDEKNKKVTNGNVLNEDDRLRRDNSITKDGNSSIGGGNANTIEVEDLDKNGDKNPGEDDGNSDDSDDE